MRLSLRYLLVVTGLVAGACQNNTVSTAPARCPTQNLAYQLDPSGIPIARRICLPGTTCRARTWRATDLLARQHEWFFLLRGETRPTHHDNASAPAVLRDGGRRGRRESDPSNHTVDERSSSRHRTLWARSRSIRRFTWMGGQCGPVAGFKWYRLYSASYNLDTGCAVPTGARGIRYRRVPRHAACQRTPRCFGVSAISTEGYESLWTVRQDSRVPMRATCWSTRSRPTPIRRVRFWSDLNSDASASRATGLDPNGSRTDIDFVIHRHADRPCGCTVFTERAAALQHEPGGRSHVNRLRAASGYSAIRCSPGRIGTSSRSWTARCALRARCG